VRRDRESSQGIMGALYSVGTQELHASRNNYG
jgi:hypothetical protein